MNKVLVTGNLTRDPNFNNGGNTAIARYTVAVNRRSKDGGTDFLSCVAFGKGAEWAEKNLKKGSHVSIVGHIQTGSYTNKDGATVYTTDIIVENQETSFNKGKADGKAEADAPKANNAALEGFAVMDDDDDDLPF